LATQVTENEEKEETWFLSSALFSWSKEKVQKPTVTQLCVLAGLFARWQQDYYIPREQNHNAESAICNDCNPQFGHGVNT